MANKRVPEEVHNAMQIAKAAGWPVSIRNEKIGITAPDGTKITVGMNPNDESMKVFRSNARKYNLIEQGPAMTPTQREQQLKEAEEAGLREAAAKNEQRQAYEAEQAKKKAEAEAAKKKAAAAIAKGLAAERPLIVELVPDQKKPTAPKKATVPAQKGPAFPKFDAALLGTTDYGKFLLKDGSFYCIECWQRGDKFTAKAPQGLATHRGFRHSMYQGTPLNQEASRMTQLPTDVAEAFELMVATVAEHLATPAEDPAKVAELEQKVADLTKALAESKALAAEDVKKVDALFADFRAKTSETIEKQKSEIHRLAKELSGKEGLHEAEVKAHQDVFKALLTQVREAVNNLAPVQAVGKIDGLVSDFLGK